MPQVYNGSIGQFQDIVPNASTPGGAAYIGPNGVAIYPNTSGNYGMQGVLGLDTSSQQQADPAKQNGGWYNGVQYWEPGKGPQNNNNNNASQNNGGGVDTGAIDSAYAPTLSALQDAINFANQSATGQEKNVVDQYGNSVTNADTEQKQLLTEQGASQDKFNQVISSALNEAFRAYNALNQQRTARYGRGGSAGMATGELAQQEFLRQQGQIGQKGVEGNQQFELQKGNIMTFVAQKKKELELWKNDAVVKIKDTLGQTLNQINSQKGTIEANKTIAKMNALQGVRDQLVSIQNADRQFQQQLGVAAISKMQELAGRVFTPKEINAYMSEFTSSLPGNMGAGTTQQAGQQVWRKNPQTGKDELVDLQTNQVVQS